MEPPPGESVLLFVGDRVRFALKTEPPGGLPQGCCAFVRSNLGRAERVRSEIIDSYTRKLPSAGACWRDIPMREAGGEWMLELPVVEVGYFQAKAYFIDAAGRQHWPEGRNVGITVHPDHYRTANTIYCAFVRMFGPGQTAVETVNPPLEAQLARLDKQGYAVIPPSGKLRGLCRQLDHIIGTLGCRILHLLPVNPVPVTCARFGRFGSPYAAQDLMAIDPALVEFDRRTTGVDQFRELTYGAHLRGARVFLDITTNHTGWGSTLQENHPEWFLREPNGQFASPGAWGTVWEDLVELDHRNPASWEHLAEVFLTWCRRGVDGFRCDAGYKVPMPAWRYITACVRQEYPETLFLLEGLGGSWEATETLLTDGGMQWAYSELFQNYTGAQVGSYLDYALRQSNRVGIYVHYSETHDNPRLAQNGRSWSLLRNRLSALTSVSGAYGFTCGVEWLAPERINVHSSRGLNWGGEPNLVDELGRLNQLLAGHPCFYDNARLSRVSPPDSAVYALRRDSEEGADSVLVLVNTDVEGAHDFAMDASLFTELGRPGIDLLTHMPPPAKQNPDGLIVFTLAPGACHCLSARARPAGLAGDAYRQARAAAAFALQALGHVLPAEAVGPFSWRELAARFERDPAGCLSALLRLDPAEVQQNLTSALDAALAKPQLRQTVHWSVADARRILLIPPDHWLLVRQECPFRVTLAAGLAANPVHVQSIQTLSDHVACLPPRRFGGGGRLLLERYAPQQQGHVEGTLRFLENQPRVGSGSCYIHEGTSNETDSPVVLLTNGRGGMARLRCDFGRVQSKYDCLLAANLHPEVPVDRHVFVKRCRAWLIADRFLTGLDGFNLRLCDPGPPAVWKFLANAGDGRTLEVRLELDMLEDRNTVVMRWSREEVTLASGETQDCGVNLVLRFDLEDRNFHWETKRNPGADHHFSSHSRPLRERPGFEFTPAEDRKLRVYADAGEYSHSGEWSENIPHPVEQSRGLVASGDAFSPGWFNLPLRIGEPVTVVLCADSDDPSPEEVQRFNTRRRARNERQVARAGLPETDAFGRRLALAASQFVVRRGSGKTVIAGYPWFLDWGRDTLICGRGLLAAGMTSEVREMLVTFARFEENGTLPNSIFGLDASNRDTSDASLWFGILCEEAAALSAEALYDLPVNADARPLRQVLQSIGEHYLLGTPNGIHADPDTALIWSPSHFTWMDTNYPAGTPREGYPVEIQVLWIRLLRQLARIDAPQRARWTALAARAEAAFTRLFWLEERGFFSDCLLATPGQSAAAATPDHSLRSNYLFAISLGLVSGEQARRSVDAALRHLVVPGALRSLAPLPVHPPLPIHTADGRLLNNPQEPYWGQYEGDEDTRRKPAYHNGTAWTWTFPSFCEALVRAWDGAPQAVAAAKAYLSSFDDLLGHGCLGHLPEIVDGDAPHPQRGCDAQAWGVTEALRVWKWLQVLDAQGSKGR